MVAIISLLVVLTLSILITRIAAVALTHTGLSREIAAFQARSAFSGVGFTTREAEDVVNHPVRRRVVRTLMLLGNIGIATVVTSLILSTMTARRSTTAFLLLCAGLLLILLAARSRRLDRHLSRVMDRALSRYTDLDIRDYASLLHLAGEYHITELMCRPGDWLEGRALAELKLRDEGIVVLGITRADGTYLGAPRGPTKVLANDTLLLYGRVQAIESLDQRRQDAWGEREHQLAVAEQDRCIVEERIRDTTDPAEEQGGDTSHSSRRGGDRAGARTERAGSRSRR